MLQIFAGKVHALQRKTNPLPFFSFQFALASIPDILPRLDWLGFREKPAQRNILSQMSF